MKKLDNIEQSIDSMQSIFCKRLEEAYNEAKAKGIVKNLTDVVQKMHLCGLTPSEKTDRRYFNDFLNGIKEPNTKELAFFCELFQTNPNYLMGYNVEPSEKVQSASKLTGLSEENIRQLMTWKEKYKNHYSYDLLNTFFHYGDNAKNFLWLFSCYMLGEYEFDIDDISAYSDADSVLVHDKKHMENLLAIDSDDINDVLMLQFQKQLFEWRKKFKKDSQADKLPDNLK